MADQEQKALDFMAQAEKKLKSAGGIFGSFFGWVRKVGGYSCRDAHLINIHIAPCYFLLFSTKSTNAVNSFKIWFWHSYWIAVRNSYVDNACTKTYIIWRSEGRSVIGGQIKRREGRLGLVLWSKCLEVRHSDSEFRVTRCPGLPGTVPEWDKMSRVPARFIPGQCNVPEWIFLEQ